MINKILEGIFNLIISLVNVILSPIENMINLLVPSLLPGIGVVGDFIDYILSYIPWVISILGLTSTTMAIISGLITAIVMIPLTAHAIKLGIKWYYALKL